MVLGGGWMVFSGVGWCSLVVEGAQVVDWGVRWWSEMLVWSPGVVARSPEVGWWWQKIVSGGGRPLMVAQGKSQ